MTPAGGSRDQLYPGSFILAGGMASYSRRAQYPTFAIPMHQFTAFTGTAGITCWLAR